MPLDYDILEPEAAPAQDYDILEPEIEEPSFRPVFSEQEMPGFGVPPPTPLAAVSPRASQPFLDAWEALSPEDRQAAFDRAMEAQFESGAPSLNEPITPETVDVLANFLESSDDPVAKAYRALVPASAQAAFQTPAGRAAAAGALETGRGFGQFATSRAGLGTAVATQIPLLREALGLYFASTTAKSGAELLGEASQTGDVYTGVRGGLTLAAAPTMAAPVGGIPRQVPLWREAARQARGLPPSPPPVIPLPKPQPVGVPNANRELRPGVVAETQPTPAVPGVGPEVRQAGAPPNAGGAGAPVPEVRPPGNAPSGGGEAVAGAGQVPVAPTPLPPPPEGSIVETTPMVLVPGKVNRWFEIKKGTFTLDDGGVYGPGSRLNEGQLRRAGFEPPAMPDEIRVKMEEALADVVKLRAERAKAAASASTASTAAGVAPTPGALSPELEAIAQKTAAGTPLTRAEIDVLATGTPEVDALYRARLAELRGAGKAAEAPAAAAAPATPAPAPAAPAPAPAPAAPVPKPDIIEGKRTTNRGLATHPMQRNMGEGKYPVRVRIVQAGRNSGVYNVEHGYFDTIREKLEGKDVGEQFARIASKLPLRRAKAAARSWLEKVKDVDAGGRAILEEAAESAAIDKVTTEVAKAGERTGPIGARAVKSGLVSELDKAIAKAPSEVNLPPAQVDALTALREEMARDDTGRGRKDVDSARARLEKAVADTLLGKVALDIPGDGTFEVWNTKEALQQVRDAANRIKTAPVEEAAPKIPSEKKDAEAQLKKDEMDALTLYGDSANAYRRLGAQLDQAETLGLEQPQVNRLKKLVNRLAESVSQDWLTAQQKTNNARRQLRQARGGELVAVQKVIDKLAEEEAAALADATAKLGHKPWESRPAPDISSGPGAMSPGQLAQRGGAGPAVPPKLPPGPGTPVTLEEFDPSIGTHRKPRTYHVFNDVNSPQFTFWFGRLGEFAKAAWERIVLAEMAIRKGVGRDVRVYVKGVMDTLPWRLRRKGAQAFFEILDGKKFEDIEAQWQGRPGGDKVIAAARLVKTRLEEIRTTIRDTKRQTYTDALMGMKRSTLEELFRENISDSIDTSQYTKESFAQALANAEFPDHWGIADGTYLPHMFFGDWVVSALLPSDLKPGFVLRAKTEAAAKAGIYEYVKEHPEYGSAHWKVEQDMTVPGDMLRLGDRQFWKLVGDMKENLVSEFDVKAALKGVVGRKAAKQKWWGNTQRRYGFGNYSHNFEEVMTRYLHGFHRWKELSQMQKEVSPLIEKVRAENRPAAADALTDLVDYVWGKPARSTVLFDNFLNRVPGVRSIVKPLALERWSRNLRSTVAQLTLSTVRFALVNRLQPLQGLYPLVGARAMLEAAALRRSAAGKALLDEAGVSFDPGQYGVEGSFRGKLTEFRERFSGEKPNQEIAFLAMYKFARRQGMSHEAALKYGKLRGQLFTQFTPLLADIPPALRGPISGVLFQFKRFPIKQLELLGRLAAEKNLPGIARWFITVSLLGGSAYYMRQFLIPAKYRKEFRDMLVKNLGTNLADIITYGLPGLAGADISGSLTLGDEPFGQSLYEKAGRQLVGPAVSIAYETQKAARTARRMPLDSWQEAETTLRRYPTLRPIAELIALARADVDIRSPDGEVRYRRTIGDAIRGIGALRSTSESNVTLYTNWIVALEDEIKGLKNAYFVAQEQGEAAIEAAQDAITKFNERWPEFSIRRDELRGYLRRRREGAGKTDVERLAGQRFRSVLPEIQEE